MSKPHIRSLSIVGFALGLFSACVEERPNPEHCSNQQGDLACAERFGSERPFCAMLDCTNEAWGCVAEAPEDACYSPCGGGNDALTDTSCLGTADESGESADTGLACVSDEDCGGDQPFCVDGLCIDCSGAADPDAACASLGQGTYPICASGQCVECTPEATDACDEATPVCDADTNECVGCDYHEQCPGSACEMLAGSCLPSQSVWHVDGDGGQDFLTIGQALLQIQPGEAGTIIVHERNGGAAYDEPLVISDGRTVGLLAAPGERPFVENPAGTTLQIEPDAEVYIEGFSIAGIEPIRVSGAVLYLDRTHVQGGVAPGIALGSDARLLARNSILLSTSSDNFSGAAIFVDASRFEITYSTIIGRLSNPAIICSNGNTGSSLRNSLIAGESDADALACAEVTLLNNALEDATAYPGNATIGELQPEWFVGGSNYHLTSMAPVEIGATAVWQAGDPKLDFDGDPRAAEPGAADFAGADVIVQ